MKIDDAAAHLEALGNPTGLKIYRALIRAGGAGLAVGRLQEKLKIAPSTLSHHIKALVVVGLVTQVRDATTLICHANYEVMRELVGFLVAECCTESAETTDDLPRHSAPRFSTFISIFLVLWENMMSEAKTVAIIGAGPVGLAAAARVLERGLEPIVLEAGDHVGHALRDWGRVQLFSPWEYNIDKAAARLLATTGWNSPEPGQYPTGAEMVERYLEPLAAHAALEPHIRTSSRVTGIGRIEFDKLKTRGREAAPFEIRYQNGQGPKLVKADADHRRIRHLAFAEPGGRQRPSRHRREGGCGPDRLRHARRAGQGPRALCRQDRRGAGIRTFRDRHADRSGKARRTGARHPADLAVARQRSCQGLRRRSERQAGSPR